MARNPTDVVKDTLGNLMMQVAMLTAENEDLKEKLVQLEKEKENGPK